jgi:hypothetical protein
MLLMTAASSAYGCPDVGKDDTMTVWSFRCHTYCPNEACSGYNQGTNCATYPLLEACCTWCNRFGQCDEYYGNYAQVTGCFS